MVGKSRIPRDVDTEREVLVKTDRGESYAPLPTPRHGAGAATIGDAIYFAGGAPVTGTAFLTSVNEAFALN